MIKFIHPWKGKSDWKGRRKPSSETKTKLSGAPFYECHRLSTWFRYKEWLIKADVINVLFDFAYKEDLAKYNVTWDEWDHDTITHHHFSCIEELAQNICNMFGTADEFIGTCVDMQEMLNRCGAEAYYRCAANEIKFDINKYKSDPVGYAAEIREKTL